MRTWTNEPPWWEASEDAVRLRTAPRTDFWRHTHYGFVRDSGHLWSAQATGDFALEALVDGDFDAQYDQAGLMIRAGATEWIKCGIELVDGGQRLSCVVTRESSDWSMAPRQDAGGPLRVSLARVGGTVTVSVGPADAPQVLRVAAFSEGAVAAGVMAASPDGPGFAARFTSVRLSPRRGGAPATGYVEAVTAQATSGEDHDR